MFEGPGFAISYPPDWSPRAPEDQVQAAFDVELDRLGDPGTTPVVAMGAETEQAFAALGIQEFTAAFVAQQTLSIPGYEVIDQEPIDIPGATGRDG